jgi:hypothetical protein
MFYPMNPWLRRLLYGVIFIIWLVVMSFPVFAFLLATQGEIQFGNEPRSHLRLFLLQEPDVGGIGVEWTRSFLRQPTCSQTTVTYVLWEGEGDNVSFCHCYDALTGELLPANLQPCNSP